MGEGRSGLWGLSLLVVKHQKKIRTPQCRGVPPEGGGPSCPLRVSLSLRKTAHPFPQSLGHLEKQCSERYGCSGHPNLLSKTLEPTSYIQFLVTCWSKRSTDCGIQNNQFRMATLPHPLFQIYCHTQFQIPPVYPKLPSSLFKCIASPFPVPGFLSRVSQCSISEGPVFLTTV